MHFYSVSSYIAIALLFNTIYMYLSHTLKKRNKKKNTSPTVHRSLKVPAKPPTLRSLFHPGFLSLCITRPCYQPFTFLFFGPFFFTSLASWDNDQVNYPSIRQIGYCSSRPSVYPENPPPKSLCETCKISGTSQQTYVVPLALIPLDPYYTTMILPFPSRGK